MGMRSLFPVSWCLTPGSSRRSIRPRTGSAAIHRAARSAVETLETRVLFAAITATLNPPVPITATGSPLEEVELIYVDPVGQTMSGFAGTNITINGPVATTTNPIATVVQANGTATAVYAVNAPAGDFTAADNGTYTIGLNAGVTDAAANTVTPVANIGSFSVAIPPTAIVTPPATITAGSTTNTQVVVTYTSPGGLINASTISTNNITVNGPAGIGNQTLTIASVSPGGLVNAGSEVVTYTVDAPNNAPWSNTHNGNYTIGIVGNVDDTNGNPVAAQPDAANFFVQATDAPIAVLTNPSSITTDGGNTEAIVVTYTDPSASLPTPVLVAGSSINTNNISIVSPNSTPITITGFTPNPASNGSPLVVTYTASLPAGKTWNSLFNGTYTIKLNGTVKGTDGTAIVPVANFGTFVVATPDTISPTVQLNLAPPVLSPLVSQTQIVVAYIDETAMDSASIDAAGTAAITVTNQSTGEQLDVVDEQISDATPGDAKVVLVTYTLEQPDGNNFTQADNGSYTVAFPGSPAITDTTGHAVPPNPDVGTLIVDVGNTLRPVGTVTVSTPTVTTNTITGETLTFVLTGTSPINVSTITLNSLSVLGSTGVALSPSSLSLSSAVNATTVTAIYVVNPPNGLLFQGVDSGTYTVTLNGVTDTTGLSLLPSSVTTTFTVDIVTPQNRQFVGQFGIFNGKDHKLHFYDVPIGTYVTVSALGGQGGLIQESDGSLTMNMTDFGGGLSVNLTTNNNRPITLDNVIVAGSLTKFQAPTSNLAGTFQVSGNVNNMKVRQIVGSLNSATNTLGIPVTPATPTTAAIPASVSTTGTLVATGEILNLTVLRAVTDAQILSGVNFGADGIFGTNPNTLVDDDSYGPGFIDNIIVRGSYTNSVVAVGAAPGVDGIFGYNPLTQTDDDVRAGTTASVIANITAATSDGVTRFEAGQFGTFKFNGKKRQAPNPALDNRFKGL